MKISLTTSARVITTGLDTLADTINTFRPDDISEKNRARAKNEALRSHAGQGGGYTYDYKIVDGFGVSLDAEIDDDLILMILPVLIQLAQIVLPVISVGKAILSLLDGLKNQFHAVGMEFTSKFQERFSREKSYAVASIYSEELELANVVVVEDDGYGNLRLISSDACWNEYDGDIVMKVFMKAYKRGQDTANDKKTRYPLITFEKISRSKAMAKAAEMRPALQADVDGMKSKNDAQ